MFCVCVSVRVFLIIFYVCVFYVFLCMCLFVEFVCMFACIRLCEIVTVWGRWKIGKYSWMLRYKSGEVGTSNQYLVVPKIRCFRP